MRQAVIDADWGTADNTLAPIIKDNLVRLGAIPQAPTSLDPVDILINGINWPTDTEFRGSTERFREMMMADSSRDYQQMTEIELQDAMPHRCDSFRFLPASSRGSFYAGWQSDFSGVDATSMFPFATDGHYFYLIGYNPNDPADPLVYIVDHETTDETPYNKCSSTVGDLLAVLATA